MKKDYFFKQVIAICILGLAVVVMFQLNGCDRVSRADTPEARDARTVAMQQDQYSKAQPVPVFNWSLERDLLIKLYQVRNQKVTTHSVWRSDYGTIEGDCPSLGYGLPYDTSLTNPLVATDIDAQGEEHQYHGNINGIGGALTSVEQPEPNGIFASKNTAATWVLCLGKDGGLEPVYVETKVTVYPGSVRVDYEKNRVTRYGEATVKMEK